MGNEYFTASVLFTFSDKSIYMSYFYKITLIQNLN